MTWPNEEEAITYMGWWSEDEKKDSPEPWETFTLMVHGREAGDSRNATVEDLRLAGFVPATEPGFTLEEIERLIVGWVDELNIHLAKGSKINYIDPDILWADLRTRLQESRR